MLCLSFFLVQGNQEYSDSQTQDDSENLNPSICLRFVELITGRFFLKGVTYLTYSSWASPWILPYAFLDVYKHREDANEANIYLSLDSLALKN